MALSNILNNSMLLGRGRGRGRGREKGDRLFLHEREREREREMGVMQSRLREVSSSRGLRCSLLFGLFAWCLPKFSPRLRGGNHQPPVETSRAVLSCTACALFGWTLSKLEDLHNKSSPPPPNSYCIICMEWKPLTETFLMDRCSHSFCSSCVAQYVAAKVADNSVTIRCPDPDCRVGLLEPETCRPILPVTVVDRWERAVCELVIGPAKFYCPFRDCSALLEDDRGGNHGAIRQSECPHCHRLFCARCQVPWHAGVSCDQYRRLGKDERGREDLLLVEMATTHRWQRCPNCSYFVERTQGCRFIKCRCGYKFCYGCATEMKRDHYCDKCKR